MPPQPRDGKVVTGILAKFSSWASDDLPFARRSFPERRNGPPASGWFPGGVTPTSIPAGDALGQLGSSARAVPACWGLTSFLVGGNVTNCFPEHRGSNLRGQCGGHNGRRGGRRSAGHGDERQQPDQETRARSAEPYGDSLPFNLSSAARRKGIGRRTCAYPSMRAFRLARTVCASCSFILWMIGSASLPRTAPGMV